MKYSSLLLALLATLLFSCQKITVNPNQGLVGAWTTGEYDESNPFSRSITLTFSECSDLPCGGTLIDNKKFSNFTWSVAGETITFSNSESFLDDNTWEIDKLKDGKLQITPNSASSPYSILEFKATEIQ